MSGLEKFENTAEWRAKLRSLLLKENNPQPQHFIITEQRYSLDISEDLQKLINKAKEKKMNENTKSGIGDNKENKIVNKNKFGCEQATSGGKNDDKFGNFEKQTHVKSEISDESFEAMEFMCMSQIEDIEAPSRFWENTVLQTSPVKMVGLLRPSTIHECAENSDVSSTQASYQSALRAPLSEISSSCYETASDTFSFNKERKKHDELDFHTSVNLIDLENTIKVEEIKDNLIEFSYKEDPNESKNDSDKIDYIDLTIDANQPSDESDEESVIEVLSDDDDHEEINNSKTTPIKFETVNMSLLDAENNHDVFSTSATVLENSLHFNDTLEEVEYMMKKGMEFMNQTGAVSKQSPFKPNPLLEETTLIKSPVTANIRNKAFSPKRSPCATKYSPQKSALKLPNRFAVDIKPVPKFELFKKPISASKPTVVVTRNKERFAHVISPIGAYIKKTPEAPLMTSVIAKGRNINSSVFRELEFESRKYQPQFKILSGPGETDLSTLPKSPVPRSLPKKAYISSEYRQIVDQRDTVIIPGGKSIQKYLGNVVLPAVIQHDGKAKIPGNSSETSTLTSKSDRPKENVETPYQFETKNDNSYANLSVITGDVSLYTIKDAQKF